MSKLLLDSQPLVIIPELAEKIGLNESIILQQIHYWLQRVNNVKDGYNWVYNSIKEWEKQFPFWSYSTIKRTIKNLETKELIISACYNKMKRDRTKWYRINYKKIGGVDPMQEVKMTQPLGQNDPMQEVKMTQPLPETSTETISEITSFSRSEEKKYISKNKSNNKKYDIPISESETGGVPLKKSVDAVENIRQKLSL